MELVWLLLEMGGSLNRELQGSFKGVPGSFSVNGGIAISCNKSPIILGLH